MDIKEIIDSLKRLEEKGKINFFEIEKRLSTIESKLESSMPENFNERLQEIEDLILLMQLENIKMKESHVSGIYEHETEIEPKAEPAASRLEERISELEEKIGAASDSAGASEEMISKLKNAEVFVKELSSIDKRISGLEDAIESLRHEKENIRPSSLLSDVNKILKG